MSTHSSGDQASLLIDAYVDGTASAEQRQAFERLVASDAKFREEFELHLRIESRLRIIMQVPDAPAAPNAAAAIESPSALPLTGRSGSSKLPSWTRLAAALAITGIAIAAVVLQPWKGLMGRPESEIAMSTVLDRLVNDGFVPTVVCDTDEKFVQYTKDKLGTGFLVKKPDDVELVGWTYSNGLLGADAPVLLARHGGKPIIIAMNRRSEDRAMRPDPANKGMTLHRREFEGVVFYEYSDSAEPVVISRLAKP